MKRFNNYLTEAKVSKSNLSKVSDIFKRIIEKNLSLRLYRFGGDKGFCEIKNGIGVLYISKEKRAFRLNYIKGEIQSITLWDNFSIGSIGDFTINLGGIGLMAAGKKLIDVLKKPSVGKVAVYPELIENAELLSEAKRIKPADFYKIINDNIPSGVSMTAVPRSMVIDIAAANDYSIPVVIYKTKVDGTRGKTTKYDLTRLLSDPEIEPNKVSKENEPIYYMKITAQDPNSKKFLSVKGDKKAEEYLKRAYDSVQNPDYQSEMKDPDTLFGHMANLVSIVCRGNRNSLVIYGGAGIGKCAAPEELITIRKTE